MNWRGGAGASSPILSKAVLRALHALSHGISIAAIIALLLNDHYLRVHHPSWLTGKLGDFAWLLFAPFVCALAFGVIARGRIHERVTGAVAFVFIGVWFALAKTTVPVHRWTTATLDFILGYRGSLRMDPTDLLALPALWIGWRVWKKADNHPERVKPYVWALLAAGVMATMATSAAYPENGIVRLCGAGETIYALESSATAGAAAYVSVDGGFNWKATDAAAAKQACGARPDVRQFPLKASHDARLYRTNFEGGKRAIESSADDGKSWTVEFKLPDLDSEARRVMYRRAGLGSLTPGPLDVAVSEQGTIIFAMGTDGALVRSAAGEWRWVPVGNYQYREFGLKDRLGSLVSGEIAPALPIAPAFILTVLFTALVFLTTGKPLTTYTRFRWVFTVVTWIVFALAWLPVPVFAINIFFPFLFPVSIVLAIVSAIQIGRISRPALVTLATLATTSGALFLVPFVMWAYGTVPRWEIAHLYATMIGAGAAVSSRVTIRLAFPDLFNPRRGSENLPPLT